ncbi:MAG: hypothetical protein GY906_11645 [bacterium]|nr:hypothetical protein [bacterium]
MSIALDKAGIERGAVKLERDRSFRILNRFGFRPPSASVRTLAGTAVTTEFIIPGSDPKLVIALENLTEAETLIVQQLLEGIGPLTCKPTPGDATDYTVTLGPASEQTIEPIIVPDGYPNNAPTDIRRHRAELTLYIQ